MDWKIPLICWVRVPSLACKFTGVVGSYCQCRFRFGLDLKKLRRSSEGSYGLVLIWLRTKERECCFAWKFAALWWFRASLVEWNKTTMLKVEAYPGLFWLQ